MKLNTDLIIGFCACPIVNFLLWTSLQSNDSWALPWIVNGIVLALAFLFRPDFGVGYIAFFGFIVTVVMIVSVCVMAACFVAIWFA